MKFTKIPDSTFKTLQLNAGIIVDSFNPTTQEIGNIIGATSGGNKFEAVPEFKDFGEDIDNCPKNMKELKQIESWEVKMSGSFVSVSTNVAKLAVGAADIDSTDTTKVVPRRDVKQSDFTDFWWVGDYSNANDGANAGFIAIHLLNALSTGGFKLEATDKEKGKFEFEIMGHFSMDAQDVVPFEIYIKQGVTKYTLTYDANGGTGTMTDANSPYNEGAEVTTKTNAFTAPTGKTFDKWNTKANGTGTQYAVGAKFNINANTTLYAIWK